MNLLRRFTLVGTTATVVDVVALILLFELAHWPAWLADTAAVVAATAVSWCLHGLVTFPDDPTRAWFRQRGTYLRTAGLALVVDVAIVSLLDAALHPGWWGALLVIKVPALFAAFLTRMLNYRPAMFQTVRGTQAEPARRPPAPGSFRLSVVVPAYREADRIGETVGRIRDELTRIGSDGGLEIIVVDDGSGDDTADRAEPPAPTRSCGSGPTAARARRSVPACSPRRGAPSRSPTPTCRTRPPRSCRLLDDVEAGWDVVVGSRQHVDTRTVVRAGRLREVGGRIINTADGAGAARALPATPSAVSRPSAPTWRELVFSHSRIDGFAFDVEVFHLVERYRLTLARGARRGGQLVALHGERGA